MRVFLIRQPVHLSPTRTVAISPALPTARAARRVKPSSLQQACELSRGGKTQAEQGGKHPGDKCPPTASLLRSNPHKAQGDRKETGRRQEGDKRETGWPHALVTRALLLRVFSNAPTRHPRRSAAQHGTAQQRTQMRTGPDRAHFCQPILKRFATASCGRGRPMGPNGQGTGWSSAGHVGSDGRQAAPAHPRRRRRPRRARAPRATRRPAALPIPGGWPRPPAPAAHRLAQHRPGAEDGAGSTRRRRS